MGETPALHRALPPECAILHRHGALFLQTPAAAAAGRQSRLGVRFRLRCLRHAQRIKCLTVVDEFTHECSAIDVAGSIRSRRVVDVLARLISVHGAPAYVHSKLCTPTERRR